MIGITELALALGGSFAAGLNLYITVFSLGLMHRLEWIGLPSSLEVLANPWVMGTAGTLALIEFVADKVPYVDNLWDTIHTFIRVPAGAYLAAASFADVRPEFFWIAALLGGAVAFTAHGAKASTRVAVNSTPEPFSNWFLSLAEDVVVLTVVWLISSYPLVALGLVVILLVVCGSVIYLFYRFFRAVFRPGRREARA